MFKPRAREQQSRNGASWEKIGEGKLLWGFGEENTVLVLASWNQQGLLCGKFKAKHFAHIVLFNCYNSPEKLLLFPLYRQENGDPKESFSC